MNAQQLEKERELVEIRRQIEFHRLALVELRARRKLLEKRVYEPNTGELRGSDFFYVLTSELRPKVKTWIELYDKQNGGMGGVRTLAERAKVSGRLIRKVKNGNGVNDGKLVTLQTADRLLTAMGMTHVIHDLTILENRRAPVVVPDPPFSHYQED